MFISYSRADSEFVRRLHGALEAQGKDVWADWEDIRKGAEWWSRIQMGIESATAVVPVLTSAFVASRVCDDEIAHALARNKRVLPIQRGAIDDGLRQELRSLNWIDVREDEHFDERLRELIEAVDTDLEWVDEHARLLVWASEWERRERDPSLLLRGSDLDAAEQWLREQGSHREQATPLHTEYLLAGRRAQTRRQRRLLVGVTIALAVSIGLGIVALLLRSQSIQREHVAVSRQLAATALGQLATDPETSLLLASRAAEEARTEQAEFALRRALAMSYVRSARSLELRRPAYAKVSPAGDWALAIQRDGGAAAIDLESGETRRLGGPGKVDEDFGEDFEHRDALAFARDGSVAAIAQVDGTVTAWRTDSWKRIAHWPGPVASLWLDSRAGLALTVDPDYRATVRRFPSGKVIADLGAGVFGAELASGGRAVATLESKEEAADFDVRLWFGPDFKRLRLLEGDEHQFSPDGRLIVTTEEHGITVRDARTGRLVRDLAARCRCAGGTREGPARPPAAAARAGPSRRTAGGSSCPRSRATTRSSSTRAPGGPCGPSRSDRRNTSTR